MLLGLFVPGQKLITMALFCFIAMPWWLSSQCSSWQCRRFRWRTQTDLVADNDRKLFYFFLGDWKKEIPFSPVLMHKSSDRGCFDGGPLCHWRCSSSACLAMAHRAGASPLPKVIFWLLILRALFVPRCHDFLLDKPSMFPDMGGAGLCQFKPHFHLWRSQGFEKETSQMEIFIPSPVL